MSNLHLTINKHPDTILKRSEWSIEGEPERIAVSLNNKEYVIVLDPKGITFEIWALDSDGELLCLENVINTRGRKVKDFLDEIMIRG